jgi:hypothetical protein
MGRIQSGRTWHLVAVAMLAAAPAWADVTITQTTTVKMGAGNNSGETVTRIKGHKMRVDNAARPNADQTSMILDADGNRMIFLNHTKKEAIVNSMGDMGASLSKISDADMDAKLTPTSEKKQVAGFTCSVYDSMISVKFSMMEKQPPVEVVMTGPVCLSKDAPGRADFTQFYQYAAQKGFIFSDPATAKAQPGIAKGMAKMFQTWADAGVPLNSDIAMSFKGEGMFAQMMNKMGSGKIVSDTSKIDTATLSEDVFGVPAGYKTTSKQ